MKKYVGLSALLFLCLAGSGIESGAYQPAPVKKVQQGVKKVTKKVVGRTKKAVNTIKRSGNTVGKQAKVIAEAAVTNLPTMEWTKLQSAYDYTPNTPAIEEFPKADPNAYKIKIKFIGFNNKPVEGFFLRPKAEGVYPCVLALHGLTQDKEAAISMFGNRLLARNCAVLALDAPEHGAQRNPNKRMWSRNVLKVAIRQGNRNIRRALDWLTERKDVDIARIGLVGNSMGSIMGSILGAVDDRISVFAFCVGGDPIRPVARLLPVAERESALYVSPSLYVEHITPRPVIFFNGKKDVVIVPPAAMMLHNAAKDPKEVVWYDGGHDVPKAILDRATEWVAAKLDASQQTEGEDQPATKEPPPPNGK
jgi:uncharacterized protein